MRVLVLNAFPSSTSSVGVLLMITISWKDLYDGWGI